MLFGRESVRICICVCMYVFVCVGGRGCEDVRVYGHESVWL